MRTLRLNLSKVLASATVAGFSVVCAGALPVHAALEDQTGLNATANAASLNRQTDVPTLIGGTIRRAGGLIGAIFLALLVYGGVIWMTAQGSDEKIKKAKAIITSAIIGLVVTVAAYSISDYVLSLATTATLGDQVPLK